jgi:hypothetical protein
MRHGRRPALPSGHRLARSVAESASGHIVKQLGGSTPAASSPHRGARFASMRLMGIGQQTLPGSIRPPGGVGQGTAVNGFRR